MNEPENSEKSPFKHEKADDSPGFLLWKLIALWQGKLSLVFGELSITQTQYAILASLLWFERQDVLATQAELVEHAKIDKMTLSKAIRKLEESELIEREPSTTDTRTMQVRFTASGRNLVRRAIIAVERADGEFFSCLTEQQMETWKALAISLIAGSNK